MYNFKGIFLSIYNLSSMKRIFLLFPQKNINQVSTTKKYQTTHPTRKLCYFYKN